MEASRASKAPQVALFVTCLVDLLRPSIGFAAVKLLEKAGCAVSVPRAQTCCGQPAFNSGDRADAAAIARRVVDAFSPYDYVVAPSGSCAGMIRKHYPALLADDADYAPKAQDLSRKTHELISFLADVMKATSVEAQYIGAVTYHDSCSSLREMGVREQPRKLLYSVRGLEIKEMEDTDICCGFGGAFSAKYPDISNAMVTQKAAKAEATGADLLLGNDLGCLLNIAGKLSREGKPIQARHIAEVLAMETAEPPICAPRRKS
jgi:L-lactate dehydrogenase complex protein LldE